MFYSNAQFKIIWFFSLMTGTFLTLGTICIVYNITID